jgi:hypothetical protein
MLLVNGLTDEFVPGKWIQVDAARLLVGDESLGCEWADLPASSCSDGLVGKGRRGCGRNHGGLGCRDFHAIRGDGDPSAASVWLVDDHGYARANLGHCHDRGWRLRRMAGQGRRRSDCADSYFLRHNLAPPYFAHVCCWPYLPGEWKEAEERKNTEVGDTKTARLLDWNHMCGSGDRPPVFGRHVGMDHLAVNARQIVNRKWCKGVGGVVVEGANTDLDVRCRRGGSRLSI